MGLGQSSFGKGKNIYIYFALAFERLCLGTTRVCREVETKERNESLACGFT